MPLSAQRRYDVQWNLAAIGLGLLALVVWNVVLGVLDIAPPLRILVSFGAALMTVIVGTRWLVPTKSDGRRTRRAPRRIERTADTSDKSLAEFFADIDSGGGASLTADDHRSIVATVRSDRERPDA